MIRINLLPKEILERRKYERFYPWVALLAVVVFASVFLVWAVLVLQVGARNRELQQAQDTSKTLTTQAAAFGVFEQKEAQLQARKQTVQTALAGRINWGKLANEVSLVLPSEVWLTQYDGAQTTDAGPYDSESGKYIGFPSSCTFTGLTPDTNESSMNEGYKSLAKTLVRLNDLAMLDNVWLSESTVGQYPATTQSNEVPVMVQQFVVTAGIVAPGVEESAPASATAVSSKPAVPAPPSTPGQ